jgi:hypothetical protein
VENSSGKDEKKPGFWTSLPGVLTAVATLVTAFTGLMVGLYQNGVLGAGHAQKESAIPGANLEATHAVADPHPKPAEQAPARQVASPATILITAKDGLVTPVFAASFQQMGNYDGQLHLSSGQSIPFSKLDSLEVERVYSEHAQLRITLTGGRVIEDSMAAGSSIDGFGGESDLGMFSIGVDRLQRIAFRH